MTTRLKPYPAYKDSGVPWLGQVPEHWELRSLRASAIVEKGRLPRSLVERGHQPEGSVPYLSMNYLRSNGEIPFEYAAYQPDLVLVHRGETILLWDGANAGEFLKAKPGAVSSTAARVMPRIADQQFFFYACQQVEHTLRALAVGMGIPHVDGNVLKGLSVTIAPKAEQLAIVRYLDYEDRRIRKYIRAKQRLIALLNEQKQAIIQRAVTRGLDPNVRLKPSGVPWLGDVPEHWDVRRLKTLAKMKSGEGITGLSIDNEGAYPVVGGNGTRGYTSTYTHDGDYVVIGRQGALCGNVHFMSGQFWASEHAVVASLSPSNNLRWYGHLLEAMKLNQYSVAAAQPGLAVDRIQNLSVGVPPSAEQKEIGAFIDVGTASIDTIIASARHEIDLLREYRTRLIADVVTGKLDVRDAAANLPDESEMPPEPCDEEPAEDMPDLESEEESDDEQAET